MYGSYGCPVTNKTRLYFSRISVRAPTNHNFTYPTLCFTLRYVVCFPPLRNVTYITDRHVGLLRYVTVRFSFWPNITIDNNYFCYSRDFGANWYDMLIPTRSYDIEDINKFIQQKMKQIRPSSGTDVYPRMPILRPHAARYSTNVYLYRTNRSARIGFVRFWASGEQSSPRATRIRPILGFWGAKSPKMENSLH